MRMSISSPRRATAGVRLSIGVEATPFFRLNAVSAVGGQRGAPRRGGRLAGAVLPHGVCGAGVFAGLLEG